MGTGTQPLLPLPSPALIDRYLRLLGIARREPGLQLLNEVVAAHVTHVPFENISKLYYRKRYGLTGVPDLKRFLDGIERHHFGGTCYSCNYYLYLLLAALGFEVRLCGADMRNPDVHVVSMVRLDGREYLVDGGYGAPFLQPLPRDLTEDYVLTLGRERYVLSPRDPAGRSRMQVYRDGEPLHGYWVKPEPRRFDEFAGAVAGSFRPEATFMNAILLVRCRPGSSVTIHNYTVTISAGTRAEMTQLEDAHAVVAAIEKHFAIPARVTREALSAVPEFRSVWS